MDFGVEKGVQTLKPICMKCQLFYRPKKNGVYFTEMMPPYSGETGWRPYKIWAGDLWECKGCGHQIISGTGMNPISVQHEVDFKEKQKKLCADEIQINDC